MSGVPGPAFNRGVIAAASTDCPVVTLRPALRAIDQRAIDTHGPLAAVMRSPSLETLVRRAATVLFRDDLTPAAGAQALGFWSLMNPGLVRG